MTDTARPQPQQLEAIQYTSITPALGRIVVEYLESEFMSKGGIILPFGGEKITTAGRVVRVSLPFQSASDDKDKDAPFGPMYRKGDVVIFGKYVGCEVTLGSGFRSRKYLVMNESDILGTLHAEAP